MICFYECKNCGHEIECNVTINEEDDLPAACDNCGKFIPDKAHEDVQIQAIEKASERPDFD